MTIVVFRAERMEEFDMEHKCKITVIRKECYQDLQEQYLADPKSGECPIFEVGQEFILERNQERDDFWHMLDGKFCSEAWDAISRYVYTALQGGSIMKGWTNDEKMMIACCNDGTRPVIFKIERIDAED
ncbi:TIGR04076 family protein [Massiliimalia massiliensis]|uniref:TIGR04076 family protein n=1 Tax=Massiliimalia massiliensis TaxID=1852384 RepID=UPI001E355AED|nr:TIGR04076 family protein [Massiliimalia massiliensis]